MSRKTILEISVFLVLGIVAIAGWVRRPEPANAGNTSRRGTEFASQSGAYADDEFSGAAVEDNDSANVNWTSTGAEMKAAESGATPCIGSGKAAVYNDSYYTGPYSSSNRPVRVSTVARPSYETYVPTQTSSPHRTVRRGRTGKRRVAMVDRTAAVCGAARDLATGENGVAIRTSTTATAAFVYDRASYKKSSGL